MIVRLDLFPAHTTIKHVQAKSAVPSTMAIILLMEINRKCTMIQTGPRMITLFRHPSQHIQ